MLTRRFSPLNRYEYASILCSLLIIVFPFVDQYMFQLYSDGFLSYIILTIPLGIIPVSFEVRHVHGCFYRVRGLGRPDQSCIAAYSITCDYTLHYPDTQRPQR